MKRFKQLCKYYFNGEISNKHYEFSLECGNKSYSIGYYCFEDIMMYSCLVTKTIFVLEMSPMSSLRCHSDFFFGYQNKFLCFQLHHKNDCQYENVKCRHIGCLKTFERCIVERHEEKCNYKIIACEHCSDDIRVKDLKVLKLRMYLTTSNIYLVNKIFTLALWSICCGLFGIQRYEYRDIARIEMCLHLTYMFGQQRHKRIYFCLESFGHLQETTYQLHQ